MKPQRRVTLLMIVAALALVLSFLFYGTQAVDLEAQNRVSLSLRDMEKLDAQWNANLLRAHIGVNADYTPLAAPRPRMHALLQQLGEALPLARTSGAAAAAAHADLARALANKEKLVDQFKAQNAILRASLVYVPPAISKLKTSLAALDKLPDRIGLPLDRALNRLLADVLRYNLMPDAALGATIEQTIEQILAHRAALPPPLARSIDLLAHHARAILRYRLLENGVEAQIDATGTTAAIDRLGRVFDRAFDQVLAQKQRLRAYLFGYSAVLLVLLLYLAYRLRRSYRIIGVVNRDLKAANEGLELRVAERTAELEAQSERLLQLAYHDGLTGLINHSQLTRQLDHALLRAGRRGTTVAVMFIDLDGFKAVNDTYGHGTGDLVLKAVAQRVLAKLRKEDALARLGGDEFAILLEQVDTREGAMRVAQLALDEIVAITEAGGHPVTISASIGISSAHGSTGAARGAASLLAEADQAMYQAKQAGKARYAFSPQAQWAAQAQAPAAQCAREPAGS